jgi:hypothetical protein
VVAATSGKFVFLPVFCLTGTLTILYFAEQGCQRIVEDWQKIIQVHSLVISPEEDMRTWLKYSSLCRKSGRLVRHFNIIHLN